MEVQQLPQTPDIQEAFILEGLEHLQSMQDPIPLPDGSLMYGQKLAQFIVE